MNTLHRLLPLAMLLLLPAAGLAQAADSGGALEAGIGLMLDVWRRGAEALPAQEPLSDEGKERPVAFPPSATFSGLDDDARRFLRSRGGLAPVVQFSCAVGTSWCTAMEKELALAADADELPRAAAALVLLMKRSSPSTVVQQRKALDRMRTTVEESGDDSVWKPLLLELEKPWQPEAIARALDEVANPEATGRREDSFYWAIRAASFCSGDAFVTRLAALSTSEELYTSLAAECSLECMTGAAADAGLASCVRGMRYDASDRAARALTKRNPELLAQTLIAMTPADDDRYRYARMLAKLDLVEAVPHLAATVHKVAMVDGQMFGDMERLATREQLPLLEAMLETVRPEQRDRARQVVEAVRARQ